MFIWFIFLVPVLAVLIVFSYLAARVVSNAYFHEKYLYQVRFMGIMCERPNQAEVERD